MTMLYEKRQSSCRCPCSCPCTCPTGCGGKGWRRHTQLLLLLLSILIGIALGIGLRFAPPFNDPKNNKRALMYLRFPGELVIRMMMMLVIPLIVSSLISAMAGLSGKTSGKIGLRVAICFFVSTLLAIIEGVAIVLAVQPGKNKVHEAPRRKISTSSHTAVDAFMDMIRDLLPDNLVTSTFRMAHTQSSTKALVKNDNITTNATSDDSIENLVLTTKDGTNILGLACFSILFGIVLGNMGHRRAKPLLKFFHSFTEAIMELVKAFIWVIPIGLIFIIAVEIVKMSDPMDQVESLGMFLVTVLVGLFAHGVIVLPVLYMAITRRNPFKFIRGIVQALLVAFGTGSSYVALPVALQNMEKNNRIHPCVSRTVLPIGAAINMDGSALYEAQAAIFIAQLRGTYLSVVQIIILSITCTVVSIGAPSAGTSYLLLGIIFNAVGLPTEDIIILLAVDWALTRFRTIVNVLSDCLTAGVVHHLSKADLQDKNLDAQSVDDVIGPKSDHVLSNESVRLVNVQHQGSNRRLRRSDRHSGRPSEPPPTQPHDPIRRNPFPRQSESDTLPSDGQIQGNMPLTTFRDKHNSKTPLIQSSSNDSMTHPHHYDQPTTPHTPDPDSSPPQYSPTGQKHAKSPSNISSDSSLPRGRGRRHPNIPKSGVLKFMRTNSAGSEPNQNDSKPDDEDDNNRRRDRSTSPLPRTSSPVATQTSPPEYPEYSPNIPSHFLPPRVRNIDLPYRPRAQQKKARVSRYDSGRLSASSGELKPDNTDSDHRVGDSDGSTEYMV
ncbi:unnamed protein product [Owenia fusiformis]|uniref:Amino acid transporter n=1 Tax=Owenia fusiformis TaxID=6347 RepID=A0A8J1UIU7_OWEFU|nr:unnamed protein product [Owenia fusiformis]